MVCFYWYFFVRNAYDGVLRYLFLCGSYMDIILELLKLLRVYMVDFGEEGNVKLFLISSFGIGLWRREYGVLIYIFGFIFYFVMSDGGIRIDFLMFKLGGSYYLLG